MSLTKRSSLSTLTLVTLSASCRGVTVATSGPEDEMSSSVHIPIEFLPGIIVLLQGELNNINRGHYCLDFDAQDRQDTQGIKADATPHASIDPLEPR